MALIKAGIPSHLEEILGKVIAELDVPPGKYREAQDRYEAVGNWLGAAESPLAPYEPLVFPQGSFSLGTAIRPVDGGDYDVDGVCLLRRPPPWLTQRWLKNAVGDRLKDHDTYKDMIKPPEGGRRCWTLKYADGSQFHLDMLPAVPDDHAWLIAMGVPVQFARTALRITDRDRFDDPNWPRSNPAGYAAWFRSRMAVAVTRAKGILAEERKAEVVSVPDEDVRTPLQQVVQLLKRHRDVMFGCDADRPISIIITTLAAHAYQNEEDLDDAFSSIVKGIRQYVEQHGDSWVIANPVNPAENFADRWEKEPAKANKFFAWLEALENQAGEFLSARSLAHVKQFLGESFGDTVASGAMQRFESARGIKPGTILSASSLNESALDAPHRMRPSWPLALTHRATLTGKAHTSDYGIIDLQTRRRLGKNLPLTFKVKTTVPEPYDVHWQVVNTGSEAREANDLRGRFYLGHDVHLEHTRYRGRHSIQAFIVKNGECVARSNPLLISIG